MSYKATAFGVQYGRLTGRRYKLSPGRILDAPPGDLYGMPGVQWCGTDPEPEPPPPDVSRQTVLPQGARSVDYSVKQVREILKNVTPQEAERFIEGDPRKSVQPPR